MDPTNATLFGGKAVTVIFEDGKTEVLQVQQLRLKFYETAFKKLDDEIDFTAFACGKTKLQVETLTPNSYEELQAIVREVNAKGFFPFAARKAERAAESLRQLPPSVLEKITKNVTGNISQPPSPFMPPPAA